MTNLQIRFIKMLDDYGYDVFNTEMIKNTRLFNTSEFNSVINTLSRIGLIIRLERGKFVRSSFAEDYVIANFLASDGGIAYWTALNAHGLTEQFANKTFVQTAMRKNDISKGSRQYKFVKVDKNKLFGYNTYGYGNHQYRMTDVEKTIIDCFDMPRYSGWYQEAIKGFYNAKIYQSKLIKYCKLIKNNSLIKRLGFLADFLQKPEMDKFIEYALKTISKEYVLFEIGGKKEGKYENKWKLVLNIPKDEILEIANS